MDGLNVNGTVNRCVEVVEACGEWFVRVVDGDEELTRSFELEAFALVFAEGQRIRLGLDRFVRLWCLGFMSLASRNNDDQFSPRKATSSSACGSVMPVSAMRRCTTVRPLTALGGIATFCIILDVPSI